MSGDVDPDVRRAVALGGRLTSAIRGAHVGADTLREVRWGSEAARELSTLACDLSDGGLETRFVSLRTLGLAVRQQVWIDGHRVDGVIVQDIVGAAVVQGRPLDARRR